MSVCFDGFSGDLGVFLYCDIAVEVFVWVSGGLSVGRCPEFVR